MSDFDSKDPLWKLLGQARTTEPSPFFARNVLRTLRGLESRPGFWQRIFTHPARLAFAGAACVLIAVVSGSLLHEGPSVEPSLSAGTTETFDPASEMAAVEYLGQLMAVADPGQLDDAALGDLFF